MAIYINGVQQGGSSFGVTPSTQAFGDSATEGSSPAAARGDHKHGMPSIFPSYQAVVTGSRVVGNIYQNTTGKTMFVVISLHAASVNGEADVYTDSNSSPSTIVGKSFATTNSYTLQLSFMVLNNNYYQIQNPNGTTTVDYWTEWY